MALPSSGNEINFGALTDNRSSASKADISLRQESQLFASGAVGPTGTSRDNLNAEPHAISEFGGADYPNTLFSNVVAKVSTTTIGEYVDGETGARIYWDVDDGTTDDYTAGLKLASDNSIVLSETLDFDGYNTTNENLDNTDCDNCYIDFPEPPVTGFENKQNFTRFYFPHNDDEDWEDWGSLFLLDIVFTLIV